MRVRFLAVIAVALLLILVFAVVAQAAVPQSVIDAIIKDAMDGTIDSNWTAAEIRATLAYIQDNPVYQQYSDLEGVLEDYLASLQAPGEQGGQLAFTGGEVFLVLAAGAALIGGGVLLRRARA
jgi:glucose dehydrogenase